MKKSTNLLRILFSLIMIISVSFFPACEMDTMPDDDKASVSVDLRDEYLATLHIMHPALDDYFPIFAESTFDFDTVRGKEIEFWFAVQQENCRISGAKLDVNGLVYDMIPKKVDEMGDGIFTDALSCTVTISSGETVIRPEILYDLNFEISSEIGGSISYEKDGITEKMKFTKDETLVVDVKDVNSLFRVKLDDYDRDSYDYVMEYGSIHKIYPEEDFFNIGDINSAENQISIRRMPVKNLRVINSSSYTYEVSIDRGEVRKTVESGTSETLPIHYGKYFYVEIKNPFNSIVTDSIRWGKEDDDLFASYEKKLLFSAGWSDIDDIMIIEPEFDTQEWRLIIEEESEGLVTVTQDGKPLIGIRQEEKGKTVYGVTALSKVNVSASHDYVNEAENIRKGFSGWADTTHRRISMDILVVSPEYRVKPLYCDYNRLPHTLYVAPNLRGASAGGAPTEYEKGSEANPYVSLEKAIEDAAPGDEIRMLTGRHSVGSTLNIDKDIRITGGWQIGTSRVLFNMPGTGHGAPSNIPTVIKFNDDNHDSAYVFNVGNKVHLSLDGLHISYEVDNDVPDIQAIHAGYGSSIELSRCYLEVILTKGSQATGIYTSGDLRMSDSTIFVPMGVNVCGVNAVRPYGSPDEDGTLQQIERCNILTGKKATISRGLILGSTDCDSYVKDSYIRAVASPFGPEYNRGHFAYALSLSYGTISNNDIYVSSLHESSDSKAIAYRPMEQGGQIIMSKNRIIGYSSIQTDGAPFIEFLGGNAFFLNNIIDFSGSDSGTDVVNFRNCDATLIGNFIKASQIANYCNPLVAFGARLMLYNNTIVLSDVYDRTANPSILFTLFPSADNASDGYIINNLFIAGPGLESVVGVYTYDKNVNGMHNNAFIDFPSTPSDILLSGGWRNAILSGQDENSRHELNLEELDEYDDYFGNLGENPGEHKEGWTHDITRFDESSGSAFLVSAPEDIMISGAPYDFNELVLTAYRLGYGFPRVDYDYKEILKDMNGRSRFPLFAIGAIEPADM